jgi:hypothetical protein
MFSITAQCTGYQHNQCLPEVQQKQGMTSRNGTGPLIAPPLYHTFMITGQVLMGRNTIKYFPAIVRSLLCGPGDAPIELMDLWCRPRLLFAAGTV